MCIRFTDEEGHVGHIGEDLSLLDYSGPEAWRERIEERLEGMESVLTEVSVNTCGIDPDPNVEPPHEWVPLEGENGPIGGEAQKEQARLADSSLRRVV